MRRICCRCGADTELSPRKFLEDLTEVKTYYMASEALFLPFKLKELEVENIGPLEHFKAELGELNIITGGNASGKTEMFHSIKSALYLPRTRYMVNYELKKAGKKSLVRMKLQSPLEGITVRMNRNDPLSDVSCIVADPRVPLGGFSTLEGILTLCAKRKMQLVLFDTGRDLSPELMKRFKVNRIRLPRRKG